MCLWNAEDQKSIDFVDAYLLAFEYQETLAEGMFVRDLGAFMLWKLQIWTYIKSLDEKYLRTPKQM